MHSALRILASGELLTPGMPLRFAPASAATFQAGELLADVLPLAIAQGIVLYEVDVNYDPDADNHREDDCVDILGSSISYKEYWDLYPDEKPERPAPNWQTRILIRVGAPLLRLQSLSTNQLILAEPGSALDSSVDIPDVFFVGLISAEAPASPEQEDLIPASTPTIQPLYIRRVHASAEASSTDTWDWQLGDDAVLQAAPIPPTSQRDWAWAWHRTIGPVYFNLYVGKPADQLDAWLASLACHEYWQVGDVLVRGEKRLSFADGYLRAHPYEYHLRDDPYAREIVRLNDGVVCFTRNYHTPSALQQSLDASVLAAILAGDLGEVSWDLLDGDYVYFEASGTGRDALRQYLDPYAEEQLLRDRWRQALANYQVDASAAEDWEQVVASVSQHLLVPSGQPDAVANLERWFADTPITALPRAIQVSLKQTLYESSHEAIDRLQSANPRILWSWRLLM